MYSNQWGGGFEVAETETEDDGHSRNADMDRSAMHRQQLDETQQSWLLAPQEAKSKDKYIDLGCVVCSRKAVKFGFWGLVFAFLFIALPIIIVKSIPKHDDPPAPPDNYSVALHKALLFFNAQKSGKLPKDNGVPWRGDSGLKDGSTLTDVKGGLVGGYYDAGDNIKFHFPMAFSMTLLSWSVIEYSDKYKSLNEYDHVRELIKWGTDYLLKTFNSSATNIDHIYGQVGTAVNATTLPDDHYCWMRPEDMDYERPVMDITAGPDLAGEMAAALSSASIVFRDNATYSNTLVEAAATLFRFARSNGKRSAYSRGNLEIAMYYNSSGFFDEYMWGAAWLYYASGNASYLNLATNAGIPKNAYAFAGVDDLRVFSWDNKIPGSTLLLTRLRMLLNPGYPYEDILKSYQNNSDVNMCAYLPRFSVFNFTKGGMIQLNHGGGQALQYVANAAFLASLYADYLDATRVPGFHCGPFYVSTVELRDFAKSQIDYILGNNPNNMSYVVGYGSNYPTRVHHRGASTPRDGVKYTCTGGWKWRNTKNPDPNTIIGAMVGGPDGFDRYVDVRNNYSYTEPTVAGNAGLVAALVSLTKTGGDGVDINTIFSSVSPFYPLSPPQPSGWKP